MTIGLKSRTAKGVKLSSDEESKLYELWEMHGITDGTFSDKFRAFILYAHEHGRKFHGELPKVQCEKPNCDMFTEVDRGKYECTQERDEKIPLIRRVHLKNCASCLKQKEKKKQKRQAREQRVLNTPQEDTEHQTPQTCTTQQVQPAIKKVQQTPPKIIVNGNSVQVGTLTFDVVPAWSSVVKSDGSKMCPFSGDAVYIQKECKECKQSSQPMYSACVQVFWQEQKKKLAPVPTSSILSTSNTQKESIKLE